MSARVVAGGLRVRLGRQGAGRGALGRQMHPYSWGAVVTSVEMHLNAKRIFFHIDMVREHLDGTAPSQKAFRSNACGLAERSELASEATPGRRG